MKIWVLSDVHVELSEWDLPRPGDRPEFDVLLMAGDLMPHMERGVAWLRARVPDRPVVYVPGNHEFYGDDTDAGLARARAASRGTNVRVLENDRVVIDGVRFLGCALWTDFALFGDTLGAMRAAARGMNDYRRITTANFGRRLDPADTLARHAASRGFIAGELSRPFDGATVVVTHHGPYPGAVKRGHEHDTLSAAYVSDLTSVIERGGPELWVYGHTHRSDDIRVGASRILSNAKGYGPHAGLRLETWENPEFDPALVIEI